MNRIEFEDHVAYSRRTADFLAGYDRGCRGCSYYQGGSCTKFNAPPPADFLPQGCEHWDYDDVPF